MATVTYRSTAERQIAALRRTAKTAINRSLAIANRRLKKNISIHCAEHTLKGLAEMGHPYSTRAPQEIHTPPYLVHRQSGGLVKMLRVPEIIDTGEVLIGVFGFEEMDLPRYITAGTSKMIARPVVHGSLGEVKDEIRGVIKETFQKRYGENVAPEASFE